MKNRHGLDSFYFKQKLEQLARTAETATPYEMHRALSNLADDAGESESVADYMLRTYGPIKTK